MCVVLPAFTSALWIAPEVFCMLIAKVGSCVFSSFFCFVSLRNTPLRDKHDVFIAWSCELFDFTRCGVHCFPQRAQDREIAKERGRQEGKFRHKAL